MSAYQDFWLSCGHHLLDRDQDGRLVATDDYLKAYFARPEVAPPADACQAERKLHADVLQDPRRSVSEATIGAIADADARENWSVLITFRNHLMGHASLEAAYLDIARRNSKFPHIFINQLVHVILRNVLDGCDDPFVVRAAELFFRPQRMTLHEGSLVAADEETIAGLGQQSLSPLVSMLGLPAGAEIDVLNEDNASRYWERSDQFDMALDLTSGRRGLAALGQVITRWLAHLVAIEASVEPLHEMKDVPLTWYVGLDADATRLGDVLWRGEDLDDGARQRVLGLYRLMFANPADVVEKMRGQPIYLIAAMSVDKILRLKPQNLVTGLPIRQLEALN